MSELANKVVIVTGASSGIGAQTAVEFAKLGAQVVLTARRRKQLEETASKCYAVGLDKNKVLIVTADIMVDNDIKRIIQTTVNTFGGIDVLVNNAGEALAVGFVTSSVEDLDKMYKMHTRAVYVAIKYALPYLLKSKGNVINISSIAGNSPLPYVLPYSVAKAAQDHLTKAVALELAPKGIRINAVNPGTIQTGIFTASPGYTNDAVSLNKLMDEMRSIHPAKRIGQPEEVAKAIVFLASDAASFISGVCVPVDSGRFNSTWMPPSKI